MLNINKIRKIVKAQQGLQIPGGLITLDNNFKQIQYSIPSSISSISISSLDNPNPYMNGNSKATQVQNFIGQGSDFINNLFFSNKDGYLGKYGYLQQAGDQIYNNLTDNIMSVDPKFGSLFRGIGLANNAIMKWGNLETDSITKKDAISNSIPILSEINGAFAKKSDSFSVNNDMVNRIGSSYKGSVNSFYDSASKANKKYGLFSRKELNDTNDQISRDTKQQYTMNKIDSNASDMFSMSDLNHIKYGIDQNGGIDIRYLRAAKNGSKIQRIKKLQLHKVGGIIKQSINVDTKQIEEWSPTITECLEEDIQIMQEGGEINKQRTLAELIEYAKQQNPRFIQRLSESPKGIDFIDDKGKQSRGSHYLEWGTDDKGNAIVYPRIQEVDGQLKFFNHTDAYNRAIENNNYLIMTPDEAKIFFAEDSKYGTAYKSGWPEFFKSFKNGGKTEELESPKIEETNQKNIIPEGALHARKHNMENAENLTKKGIPVIDNEGEQQAEIEKNEIIFTLEVTKKLEELMKEETDEAAIQAGKLLVKEILFNTDDRTSLINTI